MGHIVDLPVKPHSWPDEVSQHSVQDPDCKLGWISIRYGIQVESFDQPSFLALQYVVRPHMGKKWKNTLQMQSSEGPWHHGSAPRQGQGTVQLKRVGDQRGRRRTIGQQCSWSRPSALAPQTAARRTASLPCSSSSGTGPTDLWSFWIPIFKKAKRIQISSLRNPER